MTGGMTYQLDIAMLAHKEKDSYCSWLGGRGVLYEGRVQTRQGMCRASIDYPRGSRGPFFLTLFPCPSPAKPAPHYPQTLDLHDCLSHHDVHHYTHNLHSKPSWILFICYLGRCGPACLPSCRQLRRTPGSVRATCYLRLAMQSDVYCGASSDTLPSVGAL